MPYNLNTTIHKNIPNALFQEKDFIPSKNPGFCLKSNFSMIFSYYVYNTVIINNLKKNKEVKSLTKEEKEKSTGEKRKNWYSIERAIQPLNEKRVVSPFALTPLSLHTKGNDIITKIPLLAST